MPVRGDGPRTGLKSAFSPHRERISRHELSHRRRTRENDRRSGRSEEGQDLLEYALLVALIALIAIGGVTLAGSR